MSNWKEKAGKGAKAHVVAEMRAMVGAKNDAALAVALHVAPPVISKIAHDRLPIGPSILVTLHEETGMGTREIKQRLGMSV